MANEPRYRLEKLNFDGPLELLLLLIEKNKVDIYDIPIAEITDQYIAYMDSMEETDMEIVSGFIVMASTLLDIKVKMLLPKEEKPDDEQDDPREELIARLIEYKRCRYNAEVLRAMEGPAARHFYRDGKLPEYLRAYVPKTDFDELLKDVTREELSRIFSQSLRRMKNAINERAKEFETVKRERISLISRIDGLRKYALRHSRFKFSDILSTGKKEEVIVSFLAVLELMKLGKINVSQERDMGDIEVEVNGEADLNDIDLSGIDEELEA